MADSTLASQWSELHDTQQIEALKEFARFTEAALMVDPTTVENIPLKSNNRYIRKDFQSQGAILLNNLAAKMAGMLFPVNQPNFRIQISDQMQRMAQQEHGWDVGQLQSAMATVERKASELLYIGNSYTKLQRAIKLCIVTGECLVYRDSEQRSMAVWNRHCYAVRRDPLGRVCKIILKQSVLTDSIVPVMMEHIPDEYRLSESFTMYTAVDLRDSPVPGASRIATITHEVEGKTLPLVNTMPEHLCPLFVASWTVQDGENYGRGLVENFAGDFARLSSLSENLTMYEVSSLTPLKMVSAEAASNSEEYSRAFPGDFVPNGGGNGPGIVEFDPGDYNKINAINQSISLIYQRLAQAFMYTGVQRDSERTTATEVSLAAREADQALGGAYSQLAQTLQAPLAYLTMSELGDDITEGLVGEHFKPSIVTGVQALARSADTQKLLELAQLAQTIPLLTGVDPTLDAKKILERIASNSGVDLSNLSKSAEQLNQEAQLAAQQAQAQQATNAALINNAQAAQQNLNMNGGT